MSNRIVAIGTVVLVILTNLILAGAEGWAPFSKSSPPVTQPSPATSTSSAPAAVKIPSPTAPASTVANGTQLASYTFDFPDNYTVPIGVTAPTQSQFNIDHLGDLTSSDVGAPLGLIPAGSDRMLSLAAGSTPTYQACAADTQLIDGLTAVSGAAFCLIEAGRAVGVTVVSVEQSYAVLHAVIWQDVS
jgi:hypothetical protein